MDEILASIRQSLNEDEETGAAPLDLTEAMLVPEAPPAAAAPPAGPDDSAEPAGGLLGPVAAAATAAALAQLARTVSSNRAAPVLRQAGPSIEDVVREELRPLLREWLDQHLPSLVKRLVEAEIRRLMGQPGGDRGAAG
jgi:cell pole-organizing protein PopZ